MHTLQIKQTDCKKLVLGQLGHEVAITNIYTKNCRRIVKIRKT